MDSIFFDKECDIDFDLLAKIRKDIYEHPEKSNVRFVEKSASELLNELKTSGEHYDIIGGIDTLEKAAQEEKEGYHGKAKSDNLINKNIACNLLVLYTKV